MGEKGRANKRVILSQEDQVCVERDTRVEWICTWPQEKEPRVAKEVGEVVISTRKAMRVVGATLTAIHKAFRQKWC